MPSRTPPDPALAGAANVLAANRLRPRALEPLDHRIRPTTPDAAYAIQPLLHARLETAGLGIRVGYKIGCTTPVMQEFLKIEHPCAGGIMAGTVHHHRADLRLADFVRLGIECEIAVRLGTDLIPGDALHTRDSIVHAIDTCMVAAEIVDNRYVDFHAMGTPTLIADDFFGAGCVLGDPVVNWRTLDLVSIRGHMLLNCVEVGRGTGDSVLGHPLEAVAWLANMLGAAGQVLNAGEIVLTGSLVETKWPENVGDVIDVVIDNLGRVQIALS